MGGKYLRKKTGKYANSRKSGHKIWIVITVAVLLCVIAAGLYCWHIGAFGSNPSQLPDQTAGETEETTESTIGTTVPQIQIQIPEEVSIPLGNNLKIDDLGSYTGIFMEDGTDEAVSGVMMILVTNEGDETLQYAEITLGNAQNENAHFSVSTLPPGASAVVLEKDRKPFAEGYDAVAVDNVVFFQEEPDVHGDVLNIQAVEGAINVTNITNSDITGEIQIYYKNSAKDVFYGGITYMVRIQDGLKAGEVKQLVPSHFNADSSTVMFVVIA